MEFTRNEAKVLANAKELELYDNARKPNLTKLTKTELKSLVKRSRTLRDKLRDVKRKQVRSKQAQKGSRGSGAADRSQEKAAMFTEVHDIFVERLAYVEEKEAKQKEKEKVEKAKQAAAKKAASAKKKISVAGVAPDKIKKKTRSVKATTASKSAVDPTIDADMSVQAKARKGTARAKIIQERMDKSGVPKQRAHISSLNKRRQGKKDSR